MSSIDPVITGKKRRGPQPRRSIPLPDGEVLEPRESFAIETLGVVERTVIRMKLPTTYIGNVAYVHRNKSLRMIAAGKTGSK